jgi:biopolymer transport protein ExbB
MIDFFIKGGIFMIPILLCSITALAIFIERLWHLKRSRVVPLGFIQQVEDCIRREKIPEALMLCQHDRSSIGRILLVGIKNFGEGREIIAEALEEAGRRESASLERFIEGLGTIPGISTLLGLLGTISGMIKIFSVISTQSAVNPGSLAGGISEALITTYAGLTVAIPAIVMYKYLQSKTDTLIREMEECSRRLVELLRGKEGNSGHAVSKRTEKE